MGNALGSPHVASMGLDGDWSLGIQLECAMGNALGFHGLALGLLIGDSMEVLHGEVIGMSAWGSPWHCIGTAP